MGAMLDKQSAGIRNDIDEKMKAQSASMRSDLWEDLADDLAALEGQLGRSWSEELVPLKEVFGFDKHAEEASAGDRGLEIGTDPYNVSQVRSPHFCARVHRGDLQGSERTGPH